MLPFFLSVDFPLQIDPLGVRTKTDLFEKLETLDREQHKAERHIALRLVNHYYVVASIFAAH